MSSAPFEPPSLTPVWGNYYRPDIEDEAKLVELVEMALGAKQGVPVITKRIALQKLQRAFGIENVKSALAALKKDDEEREQKELDGAERELDGALQQIQAKGGAKRPGAPSGSAPK